MKICIEQQEDGALAVYDEAAPDQAQVVESADEAIEIARGLLGGPEVAPEQEMAMAETDGALAAGFRKGRGIGL
jgi:hypothetical protein